MLKTYAVHWPGNPLVFRIPFQQDTEIQTHGQRVEFVRTGPGIKETIAALLEDLPDEEWIYWGIDDKYLIDLDAASASYFSNWVQEATVPDFCGLCFCRARRLLYPDTVGRSRAGPTDRGDRLLARFNYNQIWLHQFLRVRVLRQLFDSLPDRPFFAKEMDAFIAGLSPGGDMNLYVTEKNFAVFGESSLRGRITTGCLASMETHGLDRPVGFETVEANVSIGKMNRAEIPTTVEGGAVGRTMLLVLGPHRSGTSLTARMLECLGAVNSINQIPPQPDNPKGFFEDESVYRFNQDILLPALGANWDSVGPIDWAAVSDRTLAPLRTQAREILETNYSPHHALCVLKEPRLARLLPFWRLVLAEAGFECRLVLPVRDPLGTARSLAKRNGYPINHGALLYLRHWLELLRDGADLPLAFVLFEGIFANPRECLLKIAESLGVPLPDDFEERLRVFQETHLEADLWHQRTTGEELRKETEIPRFVRRFYDCLVECARSRDIEKLLREAECAAADLSEFDGILRAYDRLAIEKKRQGEKLAEISGQAAMQAQRSAALEAELATAQSEAGNFAAAAIQLNSKFEEAHAALAVKGAHVEELESALGAAQSTLALREKNLSEKESRILTLGEELSEARSLLTRKNAHVEELERAVGDRENHIEELASRLEWLGRSLREIHESLSWKLTGPGRWISGWAGRFAIGLPHSLRLRLAHSRFRHHRGLRFCLNSIERLFEKTRRLPSALRILWMHRRSGLFDHSWYLQQNPDVRLRTGRPFLHFAFHGVFEGRSPHPGFDALYYSEKNPDISASGVSPLLHYILWGWRENRPWRREFPSPANFEPEKGVAFSTNPASPHGSGSTDIRAIAMYLPQFHTIPENDEWWGKGFTEWTNVRRAVPQFDGHHQPHIPHPDIGWYDLNDPSVLEKQAAMARAAGIEGFCFYYYWFNGRRLLEMPTDRLLASGRPEFPFCFCWANEDWTRTWDGAGHEILVGQAHSPESDARFIHDLLPAFRDKRYIRVDGKPLLVVYRPKLLPDPLGTARRWREICRAEGIGEIFLAYMRGFEWPEPSEIGFDAAIQFPPLTADAPIINDSLKIHSPETFRGLVRDYRDMPAIFDPAQTGGTLWPCVCPSWDNTARRGEFAHSWANATPETYHRWLCKAVARLRETQPEGRRIVFINAWNEWAEGCHLEPDEKHGFAWLNATRQALLDGSTPRTLDRHPSILAARRAKLDFFLGRSTPPECEALLIHHTALLSIFHRRGGKLRFENGRLSASMDGETFSLATTKDLARLAENIWSPAESIPFCFVLLQFNNAAHTRQCVESIKRLNPHGHRVHIVIVDNASSAETVAATRSAFEGDRQVSLIFNKENLGFSRGNNLGYRLARERFGNAFVIAANNDVVFEDSDFLSKCAELYREWTYSILGPDIITPDGRHENPWNDHIYSLGEWRDLQALYRRQRETHNQTGRAEFQKTGERHPERSLTQDPILQGACLVFSPVFVETHTQAFDESLFLYGEEFPLAADCLVAGHLGVYSNTVAVRHEEAVSTNRIPEKQKIHHGYVGALKGIELALLRLEGQADALAGRTMARDPEKIRKLTNDGRRHVLVDLFFCQPGFHGGGEYGKAVFGGLAETAKSLPGTQLWAALDPDLFIDDWILEECRRSAIPIVRVKSYDEIAALVNLGAFHSFFAPAIVVYTGYEYMKRLGGELKFDSKTKTKVVGTLLDMRDYEMAANWESVATARKNAGCLPEADFNEFQWTSEKTKHAKQADELAAMYRGICSHESLHTLVTISDYSAQSIRANAGRVGAIEVLFAPEKNRPEPQPFDWPGIDFENDPYLVILNAARVEKNAASAVAAFDALFEDPGFAAGNPRLKLVLVGIRKPTELGIPSPREHRSIAAIPHLPPAELEYLLKNARGLLYPSFNEGFGYPPVEAMSLGVPCVVSNQTSIPEVCGTAAIYCDPHEIDSIASAIRELLSKPPHVELLKSHAKKIGKRQSRDLRRISDLLYDDPRPFLQRTGWCPICENEATFTSNHEWLRDHYLCPVCGSIPRERALMRILQERFPNWRDLRIHESSPVGRGASAKLAAGCKNYIHSQFDPNLGFGKTHPSKGYRSEDLERQTFADESFDLVVTQDVMEHVFDADAAFREIHRTLKPGGAHIFTTPLVKRDQPSQCRATRGSDGSVVHHGPPEFHGNPMSGEGSLVTWDWGFDITQKISAAGAGTAEILGAADERMGIEGELLEVVVQSKRTP